MGPMKNESGQAVTEYLMLVAISVVAFGLLMNAINQIGFMNLITSPMQSAFTRVYAYGHPLANGPGDGDTSKHPKLGGRLFYVLQAK
jgi:hypothetical protein